MTGVYIFDKNVLAENFLMEICPPNNVEQSSDYWLPQATLIYAVYANYEVANFSHIAKIDIVDKIAQWIGRNKYEVNEQLYSMDPEKMLKNLGTVYYLNI
jgi:hypothetical protein